MALQYVVIGHVGSDAGYWYWNGHGWTHVGGWGIEQLQEVAAAINIVREASQLKTPGLAEAATKVVSEFLNKELQGRLPQGTEGASATVIIV